jgi:hypothetical protein
VSVRDVVDVVPVDGDELVLASWSYDPIGSIVVRRIRGGVEEVLGTTPALFPSSAARFLTADRGSWWFARYGWPEAGAVVVFISSDGEVRRADIKANAGITAWAPLRGNKPRGLLMTASPDEEALLVEEVSPEGVRRVGQFPWGGEFHRTFYDGEWSAELLPDGRLVVVSTDESEHDPRLKLRLLGGQTPSEFVLPCASPLGLPLGTAVNSEGRLAIVGRTSRGQIVSMIVNVDRPQEAECHVLSDPDETAPPEPHTSPSVISTGESFVAAWIRDDGMIRAREFDASWSPVPIVNVADGARLDFPLHQLMHVDADSIRFIWMDRGGEILSRSLPKELTRFARFLAIREALCTLIAQDDGTK